MSENINKRIFINDSGQEVEIVNRQARHWLFILYCDNPIHVAAFNNFEKYKNSIILLHNRSYDPDGVLKKPHWHCVFKGDGKTVYWKWQIKDHLMLPDSDDHLFKTLSDLQYSKKSKRFTLDSYIVYLSHMLLVDKEVYRPDEFMGGSRDYARSVIEDLDTPDKVKMFRIFRLIQKYYANHEFYEYDDFLLDMDREGLLDFALKKWHIFKAKIDQKNKELFY